MQASRVLEMINDRPIQSRVGKPGKGSIDGAVPVQRAPIVVEPYRHSSYTRMSGYECGIECRTQLALWGRCDGRGISGSQLRLRATKARVQPEAQIQRSSMPSSARSLARSGASSAAKNSSSCGGATCVPDSIAC